MGKWSLKKKDDEKKQVMDREAAESQLRIFLEHYNVDFDEYAKKISKMNPDANLENGDEMGDAFADLVQEGKISIEKRDKGVYVIQHLEKKVGEIETIEYCPLKGKHRRIVYDSGAQHFNSQALVMAAAVSDKDLSFIDRLDADTSDHETAISVGQLFLCI